MPPQPHRTADIRPPACRAPDPAPPPVQAGDTKSMPVPPKRLKDLIEGTVDHHASLAFPDLQEVTIRWRGSYGYLDAWAGEGDGNDEQIPNAASSTSATTSTGASPSTPPPPR